MTTKIVTFNPATHTHLIPQIAALQILTIETEGIVMRFHPPFTPSKRHAVLTFWTKRLSTPYVPGSGDTENILLMALQTSEEQETANATTNAVETVAGIVLLCIPHNAPETGPFRAELETLIVHPSSRRGGLARRLVAELEELAMSRGRTQITLGTTRFTVAEERFYPSCGYVKWGLLPGYAYGVPGKEGEGRERVDGVFFYKNLDVEVGGT